ncbi:MFS transporter [Actinomadura sp. SCN-SB]|uniref:MFS transporter n=1 Tax=Actinomadura sp. SCN-SB TaxID=3373092 RepID=UPI0037527407
MLLGTVLNPINSSILAVSLVPIGAALGAPPSETAWLVAALYMATAVGQPVTGRLIDLFGPRRLYLAGMALTGVAGLIGMLAPNLGVLILARVLLGFGTCAGYPSAMYLIRSEGDRTGRDSPGGVLTALAVSSQVMAVIGPSLGGLLIELGGWRTTLAVNLPLAVAGMVLGMRRLPRTPMPPRAPGERRLSRLDLPGVTLFSAMLISLLLFLMNPVSARWYLPVLSVAAAVCWVVRALRVPEPFLDLRVLAGNVPLLTTYCRALLAYVVGYAALYGYTQWLEEGRGLSAAHAGFLQLPLFATAIVAATYSGRRSEIRGRLVVGAVVQVVACLLLLLLDSHSAIWLLLVVAFAFGIPQGLNGLALQNSVYYQSDHERTASSAGLLRTFTYIGAMITSCLTGLFFAERADTSGLHALALSMLGMAALFLLITIPDRALSGLGKRGA